MSDWKADAVGALATMASVSSFVVAYNALGTMILITCSLALAIHRVRRVFFGKKKDRKDDEFPLPDL